MSDNKGDEAFIEVTRLMIYRKLELIENKVIETNGKVKTNRWISSTALGICLLIVGVLLKYGV